MEINQFLADRVLSPTELAQCVTRVFDAGSEEVEVVTYDAFYKLSPRVAIHALYVHLNEGEFRTVFELAHGEKVIPLHHSRDPADFYKIVAGLVTHLRCRLLYYGDDCEEWEAIVVDTFGTHTKVAVEEWECDDGATAVRVIRRA